MSYAVSSFRKFRKVLKRLHKAGQTHLVTAAEEVALLLERSDEDMDARWKLHYQWRDHALSGNFADQRELHLGQDTLLLYTRHTKEKVIELRDIITHEELRKRK